MTSDAGGGFGPVSGQCVDLDPHDTHPLRRVPELLGARVRRSSGDLGRSLLQPVIDDDDVDLDVLLGRLERERRCQRKGVGSPAHAHDDARHSVARVVTRESTPQPVTNGEARQRDSGMGAGHGS